MSGTLCPEMSVVIFTPDTYETIRKTMGYLRRQTVRDRLEILIAAPSRDELGLDETELEPFLQWKIVEVGPDQIITEGKVSSIQQASAPIIAFAEDHAYPDPEWAAALIRAYQPGRAGVGPMVCNANSDSMTSWADLFLGFGPWVESAAAGPASGLPWHNTSYRRELLLEYGASLGLLLTVESLLQADLLTRGYTLYLETEARISHVNISRLSSYFGGQFHSARVFAAARAWYYAWPVWHRLLYTAGAPVIPLVRLRRVLGEIRRSGRQVELLPGILPMLTLGLIACGLGEMMGYALGEGGAGPKKLALESHRERHVIARRPKVNGPAA